MTMTHHAATRRLQTGQTLVVAILTLGAILIMGFVFLGLIARNVFDTGQSQRLSAAAQLAQAGARFAHDQLVNSELGADWRPAPSEIGAGSDFTRDPDALYLRPGTGFPFRDDADAMTDQGGPDGLGPFSRVGFESGRALIRVRYAPADPSVFTASTGVLRDPSKARHYLIIEAVGRPGQVNLNDPTTLPRGEAVRFRNFADAAAFRAALATLKHRDGQIVNSNKTTAFASIGIIEQARFVTNVNDVSSPIEIGFPAGVGATFDGDPVEVPVQYGAVGRMPNMGNPGLLTADVPFGASTYVNGDLLVHGEAVFNLNLTLGESLLVAGTIRGADDDARLTLRSARFDGTWQTVGTSLSNTTAPSLDSRNGSFSTVGGAVKDGIARPDAQGFARGIGRKEPPRLFVENADTGLTRYDLLTRESGPGVAGRYGHGRGVYVDNASDRQNRATRKGREQAGADESLVNDWLNPNNDQPNSGWQGNYYIPRAAQVMLLPNGFVIARDPRGPEEERFWKTPSGDNTNLQAIRYRIGDVGGQPYIVNSLTPGVDIDQTAVDFSRGQPFNGVLLFEGNVRVRGVIPTDIQLTLASKATIYVDGSIVKGVTDLGGGRLNRPSRSALALLARDYVALNTTQFFAPMVGSLQTREEVEGSLPLNPVVLNPGTGLTFGAEVLLDPASGNVPSNWQTYSALYRAADNPSLTMTPALLLSHAADAGGPAFLSLDINPGLPDPTYFFYRSRFLGGTPGGPSMAEGVFALPTPTGGTIEPNYVGGLFPPGPAPVYGLGFPDVQVYPRFETIGFPIPFASISPSAYTVRPHEGNLFSVGARTIGSDPVKDYLIARAAIVPHDVRVEATIYAEQGCFFVIPGKWFNPNPNDRRDLYNEGTTEASRIEARLNRYRNFGTLPEAPFYGEPIDVRVTVVGAISENLPAPMSQQAQWLQKWGWIPEKLGASNVSIPASHVPSWYQANGRRYVPNLALVYDPMLATSKANGFEISPANPYVRTDEYGRPLPPMPALPVSPTLAFFGEVNR